MLNNFIKASEMEIIPKLEQMGAKLIKKMPNEIAFSIKDIELYIYLEREFEVYGTIASLKTKQSVSLSELLSDYLNDQDIAIYHLSERFSMESCMRKLTDLITSKILPLIVDGKIDEAMTTVMLKRKEGLRLYNENLIEKEAEKAFKERRYADVILHNEKIARLNDVQKKRLDISKGKISK